MSLIVPLELTGLTKVFPTPAGPFVAVRNVNVRIQRSEFICILGHSGCGKSTVLSIIAGLQQATEGGVVINGRQTVAPGADRGCRVSDTVIAAVADGKRERAAGRQAEVPDAQRPHKDERTPTNTWS